FGGWADEFDAAGFADFGEIGALGQEPVTGMDRIRIQNLGCADDTRDIQIAVDAFGRADANGFVRKPHVESMTICLREHRNGLDPKLFTAEDDPEGDFSTVRNEYFSEHISNSCSPLPLPDGVELFSVFHGLTVLDEDADDFTRNVRLDLVHELHRFDNAHDGAFFHKVAHGNEGIRCG